MLAAMFTLAVFMLGILSFASDRAQPDATQLQRCPALDSIPILMYHHVGDWGDAKSDWAPWVVRPQDFDAQLDWLAARHFHTVTFQELLACRAGHGALPPNPVVLTFDDGWAEDAQIAKSHLDPRGMHGVFFVYSGAISPQDNASGYLSWNQVRQLEAAGHEVQSHTVTHPRLTEVPPSQLVDELARSRVAIEEATGHRVEVLAYPYGAHDERVVEATRRAGYALAVRADDEIGGGPSVPFRLPRFKVGYDEGIDVFARRMADHSAK
jgi:peptidoglycan/xylan/chitin deacetylase (PgdA/CDA1 family)